MKVIAQGFALRMKDWKHYHPMFPAFAINNFKEGWNDILENMLRKYVQE